MSFDKSRLVAEDYLAKDHRESAGDDRPSSPGGGVSAGLQAGLTAASIPYTHPAGLPTASISYPHPTGDRQSDGAQTWGDGDHSRAPAPPIEPAVHPTPSFHHESLQTSSQYQDSDVTNRYSINDDSTIEEPRPARQPIRVQDKSLLEAYVLCLPLGFLGLHHFYLGRIGIGFLYLFTGGVFGIGWIVDWFRLPWLVAKVNRKQQEDAERGYKLYGGPYDELYERSVTTAVLFWIPPIGWFGGHHFYLGRVGYGVAYCLTLGIFGIGWLFDLPRIWSLVQRANENIRKLKSGESVSAKWSQRMRLDDAYFLAFPLGFLGLHHFYMRRWFFGFVYFFTGGCAGVGYLIDLCRLPYLFHRTKRELETQDERFRLDDAYIMWFPFGILGMHHFYLHRWGWGFAYFFTAGLFGFGWLIDVCFLPKLVEEANRKRQYALLARRVSSSSSNQQSDVQGNAVEPSPQEQATQSRKYPPVFPNGNIAVYAFPLDQHGLPMWTEGVPWTREQGRDFQNGSINSDDTRPSWLTKIGSRTSRPPPYSHAQTYQRV